MDLQKDHGDSLFYRVGMDFARPMQKACQLGNYLHHNGTPPFIQVNTTKAEESRGSESHV